MNDHTKAVIRALQNDALPWWEYWAQNAVIRAIPNTGLVAQPVNSDTVSGSPARSGAQPDGQA